MASAELAGRPIVITGASSGIGLATALECANRGMPVVLAARRTERLEEACERINARGGKAIAVTCDVTDRQACAHLIEQAEQAFGPLHAVFANAGFGEQLPVLPDIDVHREQFEVNFWGSLNVIAPAVERMRAHGKGHVLWCSSCLSKVGLPHYAAYCASKAAQDHFARALRHELTGTGIAVSSVHPIGTRTEFFDQMKAKSGRASSLAGRGKQRLTQPPERVAQAVIKCLEKPRGEVWTSLPVRLGLAGATAFPGLADWAIGRTLRKRHAEAEAEAD